MINKFLSGTAMKHTTLTMGSDTNQIHIMHLVKMDHASLHILVIHYMALKILQLIQTGKLFHVSFWRMPVITGIPGNDLQQMYPRTKRFAELLQKREIFCKRMTEIMNEKDISDH